MRKWRALHSRSKYFRSDLYIQNFNYRNQILSLHTLCWEKERLEQEENILSVLFGVDDGALYFDYILFSFKIVRMIFHLNIE